MAAFQITITPPAKRVVKSDKLVEYVTPKLVLAPFNSTPEVTFGSVTINAKSTKPLIIHNPNPASITVQLKNIDAEDRITLSDVAFQLNAHDEKEIYISWSPIQSGYLRKIIRVQDAARKARSFDVILNGTCVSNKANDKRRRLKDESNKPRLTAPNQKKGSTMTVHNNQKFVDAGIPLRRQTYSIEEKENRLPSNTDETTSFRTSSPKYQNFNMTNYFNENPRLFDITEAPSKYSNFESDLCFNSEMSQLHSSDDANALRRGTYTLNSEERVKNPFSLTSVDEIDSSIPSTVNFYDSVYKENIRTPSLSNEKSVSFEARTTPENVFITPLKGIKYLLSPTDDVMELPETPMQSTQFNVTRDLSNDSLSSSGKRNDFIFISPPTKTKQNKRSPDHVMPRRIVSSAISDRKRHLKTNILPRRKTPPSTLKKNRVIPSVEKMKTQDPSSLRQVLRSHIDDPFLRQSLYCDEYWIDRQERDVIKWMNSLLTPPIELNEECDRTVDAAEVWLKSRREGELRAVPSVDNIAAAVYHSPQRLDTLRKVSSSLLTTEPVLSVFKKISVVTEKKIISVREDRDLHLDQGLRNKLMNLLSCYNPLWLQIALEAIYDQKIVRQGKADVGGLGWFIRKHLLTSSSANKKKAHPAVLQIKKPNYKDQVKKFILQKFLCLIYFLDQAKTRKLIRHNPCLFVITSEFKSSQELLLAFCGDLVVGRGDITKHLKAINYVLQYRQTCIDEYDYSITSLHDLKDGVRLTRLFEILFNEADLCSKLRVPAISILQKIFNVSVAMKVAESKCTIEGDITPKEIVSGHREKILSFLWQIINNYLTPLYAKSAIKIQKWWRKQLLMVRARRIVENKRHLCALIIQSVWRGYLARKKFADTYATIRRQIKAANTIKRFFKRIVAQKKQKRVNAAVILQRKFQALRKMRTERRGFCEKRQAAVKIQRWWRCKLQRKKYLESRAKIVTVQRRYRAHKLMKQERRRFVEMKQYTVKIQRRFRAIRAMQIDRKRYEDVRNSIVVVQRRFRANLKAKAERKQYLAVKIATIGIQQKYRANCQMKREREAYLKLKASVVSIQQRFRANQAMKKDVSRYVAIKTATVIVQRRFRANREMKMERERYTVLRSAVVCVQRRYRANRDMKIVQKRYVELTQATILVQRKFRANKLMESVQDHYEKLKHSCILVQRRFRANCAMKRERNEYRKLKNSVTQVQRLFRAQRLMKSERGRYMKLKTSVILVQRRFRANWVMKSQRASYNELKNKVVSIQRRFRANRQMKLEREQFVTMKTSAVLVQRVYRANRSMKTERKRFLELKKAAVFVQSRFQANREMKRRRKEYLAMKTVTVLIQRKFRAKLFMKANHERYLALKKTCIVVQRKFRANLLAKKQRNGYVEFRSKVIFIQRIFRATQAMKLEKNKYIALKKAAMTVQQRYRAILSMRKERDEYLNLRYRVICVQRLYRAKIQMLKERQRFSTLKTASVIIQRRFRAKKLAKTSREEFLKLKQATVTIQRTFRALKATKTQRIDYSKTLNAVKTIQRWYRSRLCRRDYLNKRKAAVVIQSRFRAFSEMRNNRVVYLKLKYLTLLIESRYVIDKRMKELLGKFSLSEEDVKINAFPATINLTNCACSLENKIRCLQKAKAERKNFLNLKITTIFIQRRIKKKFRIREERLRAQMEAAAILSRVERAAAKIQALWRGYVVRKQKLKKKSITVVVKKPNAILDTKVILGERYKKAILHLKTSDMYDVILHALWNLESVTMLSAKLCEGVIAEGIIPIIFSLMARGNRSEPSLEVYKAGCSILINLARYQPTKVALWENINKVEDIYLILHIMKISHDKLQLPVFRYAATLLWLLCQDASAARVVTELYSFRQQIEKMVETLKRKWTRNSMLKKNLKMLPKTETDWYPEPEHRIFDNNYVAILSVHRVLFHR